MAATVLRSNEERIGLAVALAAHAGLLALLVFRPMYAPPTAPPERIEVTIADDVGLTSTSPEPNAQAAPDIAPEIGEPAPPPAPAPAPPEPAPRPEPLPEPAPLPKVKPEPAPQPKPVPAKAQPANPQPRATPAPAPRPVPKATPSPRAAASPAARPSPAASPAARTAAASRSTTTSPTARPNANPQTRTGGSRVGADFLSGVQGARSTGQSRNAPAAAIGPAVQSALSGAISRQLKPHWLAPQGADAEKLVTILAWSLNRDGTLAGAPRVVRQDGITDANRAQAARHAEQAIRAVQLGAPFDLPEEYYDAWKRVASFRFDKRLSQ